MKGGLCDIYEHNRVTKMQDNHDKFLKHLSGSSEAVFIVAYYLYNKGYDVRINALKKAKNHGEWKNFKDDGDIFIYKNGYKYRIEVKGVSTKFTCKEDCQYPNVIVCAKHSYDMAAIKPYAYFLLNDQRTHLAIIKTSTKEYCDVIRKADRRYENVVQDFYVCPKGKIKFKPIERA